ncbi:MAG: leucine--tRNA ligase [Candidatus Hecatellales archaeon]|nr:MAG: leucine--tRNA ligase [Candidatus Hecatellales archaeon]
MSAPDFKAIEEKWQRRWAEARIFEANPDPSKPKFFATFPYPYMSGPLHVGHGYTSVRVDVVARYKRMKGFNVLFPWAWHWTGETVAGASERIKRGDKKFIEALRVIDGVPEEELEKFVEPAYMAKYYTDYNREAVKRLGLSIDWRREFHTTSLHPWFSRFVEWQYLKLREKGYVVKGTHPVVWCPRCQSPVGDADRLEGSGVYPEEYVLVKFALDDAYLPAATFRPETIFGATNLWLNPEAEYVEAEVNGEKWIVSQEAAEKLKLQLRKVRILRVFRGCELVGRRCREPIHGRMLPILPGWFVKPESASGVVYSVPAHAPYDWIALKDLQENPKLLEEFGISPEEVKAVEPISIISVEGLGEYPALEISESLGVRDQHDPKAEEATKLVYKREFHKGVMKENCGAYAGLPVAEAKQRITEDFKARGLFDSMYDLPERVVCRCTTLCTVKILQDQWFLNYSNPEWKQRVKEALSMMEVYPREARAWFEAVVDWLRDWACTRKTGLGTPLPWSPDWIVETLSDSTVYMAFYTINRLIREEAIPAEKLTPELFDYVFYGLGDLERLAGELGLNAELIKALREEFLYWYPVDLRNSGKDLIQNHLTFFIFHHVALFPREHWPRAVAVNGFMRVEGEEMHKSKGNFIPLRKAVEEHGADVTRAVVLLAAEGLDDPDWRAESLREVKANLSSLQRFILEAWRAEGKDEAEEVEAWLLSMLGGRAEKVAEALEVLKTRTALENALYEVWKDFRWYLRRTKPHPPTVRRAIKIWIRLLAPFIPHLCEELWEKIGGEGFVSLAPWPSREEAPQNLEAEELEEALKLLLEDTKHILKVTGIKPSKICYYTASPWKWEVYLEALKRGRAQVKQLIGEALSKPEARRLGKQIARMVEEASRLENSARERRLEIGMVDEASFLRRVKGFLEGELKAEVYVFREDEDGIYDPKGKASMAEPYRPAIYVE